MKEVVPPRGCMMIKVVSAGEEMLKFVVPVEYVNHPLFFRLLKEAEEYGFEQTGAIRIPCQVGKSFWSGEGTMSPSGNKYSFH
ncbi:hypothetical protein KSP40_PGU014743 [Platanthera guangdongensis]|uniref:Small auxin up regulated protein n=1 Tax=Platanthera guangdongensis TaxID=2320717 RepID=A0ABR2MHR9_9ASPA